MVQKKKEEKKRYVNVKRNNCCFLQVDIEGHELREGGLKDWLSSGALNNVNQLAIELHLGPLHTGPRYVLCKH